MRGGIGRIIRLDLDDQPADAVIKQRRAQQLGRDDRRGTVEEGGEVGTVSDHLA